MSGTFMDMNKPFIEKYEYIIKIDDGTKLFSSKYMVNVRCCRNQRGENSIIY